MGNFGSSLASQYTATDQTSTENTREKVAATGGNLSSHFCIPCALLTLGDLLSAQKTFDG